MGERPRTRATEDLLLELSRRVTSTLDLQEVLDRSFVAMRDLLSFGGGAIQLIEDGHLIPVATDPPATPEALTVRIPVGHGVSGTIAATGEAIYIPDIWNDARVHPDGRAKGVSGGVRAYLGVPLIIHGEPGGVLQIDSPVPDAFGATDRARLMAFVPTIAAAVQNALIYEHEREALEELRAAEQVKRDFLAMVSHEFRTPLTTIAGFGRTLADNAERLDKATIADIGERMWRASRRLSRMMTDMLDLSTIERGMLTVELTTVNVCDVVHDAVREQGTDEHPITLRCVESDLEVSADPERLHQVVGNLLSNSRKFSPLGSPIDVEVAPRGARVAVSVADRGRGIPPELHDRVFDRFFQAEPGTTRSAEGMGIGLYLVKQLCARMRARVELESAPGEGTRITILLRAAR